MKYRPTGLDFEAFFVSCEAIERERNNSQCVNAY